MYNSAYRYNIPIYFSSQFIYQEIFYNCFREANVRFVSSNAAIKREQYNDAERICQIEKADGERIKVPEVGAGEKTNNRSSE